MHVFHNSRPVVFFIALWFGIDEVERHTDAAYQQPQGQAPECTLNS